MVGLWGAMGGSVGCRGLSGMAVKMPVGAHVKWVVGEKLSREGVSIVGCGVVGFIQWDVFGR